MVLWEITLGTAYFLGLKRTYRLALKIQRRLISPKHPKIRSFVYRRTRTVFDAALKVHKKIQERDIEAGRNVGNWILRWLDKMKPSAEIRTKHLSDSNADASATRQLNDPSQKKISGSFQKFGLRSPKHDSDRHLFTTSRDVWPKSFPTIAMMMRPTKPAGTFFQQRHFSSSRPEGLTSYYGRLDYGLMREDILQWMHN